MLSMESWEQFLEVGPSWFTHSPSRRLQAADVLPRLAVEALTQGPAIDAVRQWQTRILKDHWPALIERQARAVDNGWSDLIAVVALVIDLLFGELPAVVAEHLRGLPVIHSRFEALRMQWQRFVPIVAESPRLTRMLTSAVSSAMIRGKRIPPAIEKEIPFWLGETPHHGRSHTLMLALLLLEQDGALALPTDLPLAATGEVSDDGQTLLPVAAVPEKMRAWFDGEPNGLFISSPLLRSEALATFPASESQRLSTSATHTELLPLEQWVVGGSIDEIRVKLSYWADSAKRSITSWDGRELDAGQVIIPELELVNDRRSSARSSEQLLTDVLGRLFAENGTIADRTIVVYGPPGSGKSTLCRLVERMFYTGPLGSVGFAVRRSARSLAEDMAALPNGTIAGWLSSRTPKYANLYPTLVQQRRLLLIIDGLDEIGGADIAQIWRTLDGLDVPIFATSRIVGSSLGKTRPHTSMRIGPITHLKARSLLTAYGRVDLAEQMKGISWNHKWGGTDAGPLAALCKAPFYLSLLCRVVNTGENLHTLNPAVLYERVFGEILNHAVHDARLDRDEAEFLTRLGPQLIGELAIDWLTSSRGFLTNVDTAAHLAKLGINGIDAIKIQRALEFGYLLTPSASGYEFSHRLLAEWAAAKSLGYRIKKHRLKMKGSVNATEAIAEFEQAELNRFVSNDKVFHESSSWQILLFYAPHAIAPLDVISWMVRTAIRTIPGSRSRYVGRVIHVRSRLDETFAAALQFAAYCNWTNRNEARQAWGFFTRAASLSAQGDPDNRPLFDVTRASAYRRDFARSVARHLLTTLPGLIAIASQTVGDRRAFRADPTKLLPFIPANQLSLFDPLLRKYNARESLRILQAYLDAGASEPPESIDALAKSTLERAQEKRKASKSLLRSDREFDELEGAIFRVALQTGHHLPWNLMREWLCEWPYHLNEFFLQWFETRPGSIASLARERTVTPPPDEQRQIAMSLLLGRAGSVESDVLEEFRQLAASPRSAALATAFKARVDFNEERHWKPHFDALASIAGLPHNDTKYDGNDAVCVKSAVDNFHTLARRREKLTEIIRHLENGMYFGDWLEQLWHSLPAGGREQDVLGSVLLEMQRLPTYMAVWAQSWNERTSDKRIVTVHEVHTDKRDELQDNPSSTLPNWKVRLLSELEHAASDANVTILCERLKQHGVREALALLMKRFVERPSRRLGDTIGALIGSENCFERQVLLDTIASGYSPPREVVASLTIDEISKLLARDAPPPLHMREQFGFEMPHLEQRFVALGSLVNPPVYETFLRRKAELAHAEVASVTDGVAQSVAQERLKGLRAWVEMLRPVVLETTDVATTSMKQIVNRLFQVLDGDAIVVHMSSVNIEARADADGNIIDVEEVHDDFDDEEDGPWPRETLNDAEAVIAGWHLVEQRLEGHPEEVREIERLLKHPSELIQASAFEELAARFPEESIKLAEHALVAHLEFAKTIRIGADPTTDFLFGLAEQRRAATTAPGKRMLAALRKQFRTAPRSVLTKLLEHPTSVIRASVCQWLQELRDSRNLDLLYVLLDDSEVDVFQAALTTCVQLDLRAFYVALGDCPRKRWSSEHYASLFRSLRQIWKLHDGPPEEVSRTLLIRMGAHAIELMRCERPSKYVPSLLSEVPSILEWFVSKVEHIVPRSELGPLASRSLRRAAKESPAQLRAAIMRILVRRKAFGIRTELVQLLRSQNRENKLIAAEGLTRLGVTKYNAQIMKVWSREFEDWRAHDLHERLAHALRRAPSEFAPLVVHLVDHLPLDPEFEEPTTEGRQRLQKVRRILERWGEADIGPLLDYLENDPSAPHSEYVIRMLGKTYRGSKSVIEEVAQRSEKSEVMQGLLQEVERPTKKILIQRIFDHVTKRILHAPS